jgi:polar amino acid transport system substrate-binding protein/glutamate/aspartate transport system substrate-binding protein
LVTTRTSTSRLEGAESSSEPYAIPLRRNDADFRLLVDQALTDFYLSDDFLSLLTTYLGSEALMLHTQIMMEHVP